MHKRPLHLPNGKGKRRYGHTGSSEQVRQHWSRWATALGAFFLEIFLCLVYIYVHKGTGIRSLAAPRAPWPAGSWLARVGLEGWQFAENNSVIFITTCFFLILKYGKIKIYRNLFNPGLVTVCPGRVSGLSYF